MDKIKSKFFHLQESRKNLASQLTAIDSRFMIFKINAEKWSAIQICFHIIKSEQLTIISLGKNLQLKDRLKKSSFISTVRSMSLTYVLKSGIKIKAPAIVANMPENYDFDELMKKWQTIRTSLKDYIDKFPAEYLNKEIYKHPIAGWLNLSQTLIFLQNHFDHHKIQIERLLSEYKNPKNFRG